MALDPVPARSESSQLEACGFYFALTQSAGIPAFAVSGGEPNLGGILLYAGELDTAGRALVIGGNVAGCATIAATADVSAQKQSVRDGVVDFLVTSLDEALRILKNEIRKRKTVAVCVGVAPELMEREMQERGVQPDLVFAGLAGHNRAVRKFGAPSREIQFREPNSGLEFITWRVAQSAARWMPKLDGIALGCLAPNSWEHRWMRLCPKYLGRSAVGERVLYCEAGIAKEIAAGITKSVQEGEIGAEVLLSVNHPEGDRTFRVSPGSNNEEPGQNNI